jgi:hypothetical protein
MVTLLSGKPLKWIFLILFAAFILKPVSLFSQENDSISTSKKEKKTPKKEKYTFQTAEGVEQGGWFSDHSPKKATYLALIPGLGQIYNRKYWKLPIVYAGFAVTGYFAFTNRVEYKNYKDAYICATNAAADTNYICNNSLAQKYPVTSLQSQMDYYRRNMELSYIFMGVWYILQMVDATVDAHLFYWDVSDDISIRTQPIVRPNVIPGVPSGGSYGLKISVNF